MNAGIAMDILKRVSGPQLDIVLLNAAAVIYVSGLVDSLQAGLKVARSSVESGHAMKTLVFLQKFY
jgi:anthranilate phosphoribosyltransferase